MAEQKIKGFNILEDLELEPETLREFYTTEFFQRTLSHIFGLYENKWKALRVNANGSLIVALESTALEKYQVLNIVAGDTLSVPYLFTLPEGMDAVRRVEVFVRNAPVLIKFIAPDDTELDLRTLPEGMMYVVDAKVKGVRVMNYIPGVNSILEIVGWY